MAITKELAFHRPNAQRRTVPHSAAQRRTAKVCLEIHVIYLLAAAFRCIASPFRFKLAIH